jgi:thiol-disulfide isomerase/thioredoxin
MLYECLTGRPPFQAATPVDTIVQVVNEEPIPPKRLQASVPRDLETVCLRCLQKDPAKRYATTQGLADDLARFLKGEPILARPIGPAERMVRLVRRRPAAAALVAVVLLGGIAVGAAGWVTSARLGAALADAQTQRTKAEYLADVAGTKQREAETNAAEAEAQKKTAEANAAEADRQKKAVAANLQKRLGTVEDMIEHFDKRLANLDGTDAVRLEFLDEMLKLNEQLRQETPDDPKLMGQAVQIHRTIGDLKATRRDYRESLAAFRSANGLLKTLAGKSPGDAGIARTQSATTYRYARVLREAKQPKAADDAYAEAIALFDQRTAAGDAKAAISAARARYHRASVLHDRDQIDAAVTLYRDALARQEKLADADPKDPDLIDDVGLTASGLAYALEATDPEAALELYRKARSAHRAAAAAAPGNRSYQENARTALTDLFDFCQRTRRHPEMATLAGDYAAENPGDVGAYNAACYYALAAKAAKSPTFGETYAKAALKHLDAAIDLGFKDRPHLLLDTDLAALRDRSDYKAFVAQLEKRFRPVTPAELLTSLTDDYTGRAGQYGQLAASAVTAVERARAGRERPAFAEYAGRVFLLAEANPAAPATLEALAWVLTTGTQAGDGGPWVDKAIGVLGKYTEKTEFANVCLALGRVKSSAGDDLLKQATAGNTDKLARGLAGYALGSSLAEQAKDAAPGSTVQADLYARSETAFEAVAKDYTGISYKDRDLGDAARRKLVEIRTLSIGRLAREIDGTTVTGQPLKLTDHRGKVTLLFFWANWCGFCRQMYPGVNALTQKYSGRPFAVVGINCDEDRETGNRAVDRFRMAFPSVWNGSVAGGKPTDTWQIDGYPALFLLDEKGLIRKIWHGREDDDVIAAAVDTLVKRAEAGKK